MTTLRKNAISLIVSHPELSKEWDFEKNYPLKPDEVSAGSNKKVWWKCKYNHSFNTVIACRTIRMTGCPYCSRKKLLTGFNDIATIYPNLALEWNYEKNDGLLPENTIANPSRKFLWWKCSQGHEWEARLDHRIREGSGCPFCSGRNAIQGKTDFATNYPELLKEWNYERNGDLLPAKITRRSGVKVWWICSKGHEWEASVHSRTGGHGCPYCAGIKAITGYNDLLTINPVFLSEWDYEKNINLSPGELSIGSGIKVWWKCSRGHEWKASVSDRNRGRGCPRCQYAGTSKPEQGIAYYLSKCCKIESRTVINGQEIDVFLPEYKIGIEYDGRYYHKNSQIKEARKKNVLSDTGIMLFRIKESDRNYVSDGIVYFDTDYLGPNYTWALITLFNMLANVTGNEAIKDIDIDTDRDSIRIRERYDLVQKENSLAVRYPYIAEEWNNDKNGILKPDMFYPGSEEKVWWKCSRGHEWEALIYSRVSGKGCPFCSGRMAIIGETDLATLRPDLINEWNEEKNNDVSISELTISSGKKVWWKCQRGHEWEASPHSRSSGSGCPYCAGKMVQKGENDLATLEPELTREWNYEKNGGLKPSEVTVSSGKKVWWKCQRGHEWQAIIANRSGKGRGCPYCAGKSVLIGYNDLSTTFPALVKEWNYKKNGSAKPSDFTRGSSKKVWWICSEGHEWESSIVNRTKNGRGCPYCADQRVIIGINDLATVNPELAKEWNYEKNKGATNGIGQDISTPDRVMSSSSQKVWWKCSKGHEWMATVNSRACKRGCPFCANTH